MLKRFTVRDELVACFLFMYCESRSALWQMFFGWRKTGPSYWEFIVSHKTIQSALAWTETVRNTSIK